MEKVIRNKIKESIIYDLEKAYSSNGQAISYWLEKLPMIEDYDEEVHNYISILEQDIRNQDREYFDFNIEELVDFYYINQEDYDFD